MRSYWALGQADKAQAALADARNALAGDPDKLRVFTQIIEGTPPTASLCRSRHRPFQPRPSAPVAAGPSAEQMSAAVNMGDKDRNEMIRSMVARLADRLNENGSDIDGWLRLMRAYVVLGERDKALAAAADARNALAGNDDNLRRIGELTKSLDWKADT